MPLLLIALEATALCLYETALKAGLLPTFCRTVQLRAPMLFSLSSFALSLLLVFRTNQSYAR
jgi:predicted membrane chloride channel (bestrophin family)